MKIVYDEQFANFKDAESRVADLMSMYPPAGYDTSVRVSAREDGTFRVVGHRFSSCD